MDTCKTRAIFILGALFVVAILSMQGIWFYQAFLTREKEFEHHVNLSLKNVAEQIYGYNGHTAPSNHLVHQLSNNYFVVLTNSHIEPGLLENWLRMEFERREINQVFEYGIYDCVNESMVYANTVEMGSSADAAWTDKSFPDWNPDNYYFGVLFPEKTTKLFFDMQHWWISTILLAFVFAYFSYVIWLFIRDKELANQQKDFVNNMTHEFKTPLATIFVSSQILSKPENLKDSDRVLRYAQIIKEESFRLTQQVQRTLEMAVDAPTELKLQKEPIDPSVFLEDFWVNLKQNPSYHSAKLSYENHIEGTRIFADKLHLGGMLHNLLENAQKYAGAYPEILLKLEASSETVAFSVRDNGIGIQKKEQKRIFKKFYRTNTGNLHEAKGFGLGLHYVKTIMKAHQGKVTVKSESGLGSTFSLIFPKIEENGPGKI